MLEIITSIRQIQVRQLLQVCEECIQKDGLTAYPNLEPNRRLLEAEQDFYCFLKSFFHIPGAFYAVWTADGHYHAALRIEPYRDGVLLTGLETAPGSRRKGYGTSLIAGTLQHLSQTGVHKVYSHISDKNNASIMTHTKCGFRKISDCAAFIDGSVDHNSGTYLFES